MESQPREFTSASECCLSTALSAPPHGPGPPPQAFRAHIWSLQKCRTTVCEQVKLGTMHSVCAKEEPVWRWEPDNYGVNEREGLLRDTRGR